VGSRPNRDLVVIGGSAGALEPLKVIVSGLPADLPAAVLVVLHIGSTGTSLLPSILSRMGGMQAVAPKDGDPPQQGYIFVATPNRHLELTPEGLRNTHGPRVNGVRPSADVLFQSAARMSGPHAIGVVLSGALDDGSAGLAAICAAGGVGIVQEPDDAVVVSMPSNAIRRARPDHLAPAKGLAELIIRAVEEPAHNGARKKSRGGGRAVFGTVAANDVEGEVTGLICPECHGGIWLENGLEYTTFRCRVGHAFSPETFFEEQAENVEAALWAAVRSLEEQASFANVMAVRAKRGNDKRARGRYERHRQLTSAHAETLRRLLVARD
jgi:two-component system chemotaxis response regulator CheB